ncbi:MAG: hypothetical protein GY775_16135 [Candidatus Scalindua sp.]|nr:hypothetical protein [Candidatus Scalindua sp.]
MSESQKTIYISLLVLFVLPIVSGKSLYAQCDKNLKPVESYSIQYRPRSNNRCEGFYESNVSSGSMNIVGVIQGSFKYKLDTKEILTLSSPIAKNKTVNVRAVGIPIKTYYRMDSQIEPYEALEWPVGEVLYAQKLSCKKIGVFGWIGSDNERIYVPIKSTSTSTKLTENGNDAIDSNIYVYLRTSIDTVNVRWRFADVLEDGTCGKAGKWIKPKKSRYRSGDSIVCKVPTEKTGSICITVRAEPHEGNNSLSCEAKILLD